MRYVLRSHFIRVYSGVAFSLFLIVFSNASAAQACEEGNELWRHKTCGSPCSQVYRPDSQSACSAHHGNVYADNYAAGNAWCRDNDTNGIRFSVIRFQICPVGECAVWNPNDNTNYTCGPPPPPPPPPGCISSDGGIGVPEEGALNVVWLDGDAPNQNIEQFCTPVYGEKAEECSNVLGYINGIQLCADEKDACELTGGSYGQVEYNPSLEGFSTDAICIPPEYAEELPTCDISSVNIISKNTSSGTNPMEGGFACSPPSEPPKPDDPTKDPTGIDQPDQGSPGTPGTCTGSDCDSETGTCTGPDCVETPGTDPVPPEENSVTGGGTCAAAPVCKGDAVQCSIHWQLWRTRCDNKLEKPSVDGSGSCGSPPVCKNDPVGCATLLQLHELRCEGSDFDLDAFTAANDPSSLGSTEDLQGTLTSIYATSGPSGSCPPPIALNVAGTSLNIQFTPFCDLATMMRPFILLIFGYLSFRIVMRAF